MTSAVWKKCCWGDLATLEYGKGLRGYSGGDFPVFGTNGQIGWHNAPLCEKPGIIIGRKGAYRGVHYSKRPFFVIDTAFFVKPKTTDFHIKWAYYQLLDFDVNNIDSGSAIPSTSREAFYAIPVNLPSLPIQYKIASILSAYDGLIENNLRRIKILEEMAKAIYEEWFVKFRFPGYEKVKMVESELGLIPEGWKVCKLEEFIEIDRGISYSGKGLTPDGKPMVNLKNILPNGGFRRDATKPYSGNYKKQHVLRAGDIVLANTDLTQAGNVVGSPAIIPTIKNCTDILFSHHIYAVRFKNEDLLPRLFAYHILLSPDFKAFAKGYASGTTVLGLPKEGVLDYVFVKPTNELMRGFADCANPLFVMMENCYQRNSTLTVTRDLLLPKLINGEIDVENLDIRIGDSDEPDI